MENLSNKPKVDVINIVLEECIMAYPVSSFIISLYKQYQQRGWLTKKQLQGLHDKAAAASSIPAERIAALEAIIRKMPNRQKSELPENKPMYTRDETVGKMIDAILAKYPQHKRVLFLQARYLNDQTLTPAEIAELKRFTDVLRINS